MGFAMLALIGVATLGLLWLLGVARALWTLIGSALMLGAAGYSLSGEPLLPGRPAADRGRQPIVVDDALVDLRTDMIGRFTSAHAYLVASDAMLRAGNPRAAVQVLLGQTARAPDDWAAWTGLGSTLAISDGVVSPAARLAFDRAEALAPRQPAPPFFLGLALIREGRYADARPFWAEALRRIPPGVSWRPQVAQRLALLDLLLAQDGQGSGGR